VNARNIPRYALSCARAILASRPRSYLKLLSSTPYVVQELPAWGFSMLVDVRDPAISKPILALREYEPSVTRVLAALLRERTRFLDIGANIGFFSLLAARRMTGGKVWSIEPDPVNARLLRANVALNGLEGSVEVLEAAASDADGEVWFSDLGHGAAIGSRFTSKVESMLRERSLPGAAAPKPVAAIAADNALRGQRVELVKVDVEGHEPLVFDGMQRILAEDRPVVVSELAPGTIRHITGTDPLRFLESVTAHRYQLAIVDDASPTLLASADSREVLARCSRRGHHADIVMIPEERAGATLAEISAG